MVSESGTQLRDRVDISAIVTIGGFSGILFVLGVDASIIGMVLAAAVVAPLGEAAIDRFGIDPALSWIGFGSVAVIAGVVQLREGGLWFGGVLLAAGCWICLDGLSARHSGGATTDSEPDTTAEEITKDEVALVGQHNRWLLEALREADRPLTGDEIRDRTGLLDADLERLLEMHGEPGPIERVGNGYTIDENEMGAGPFVRNLVGSISSRLARPFRLFRPGN
ncbi:hypothetical protein [Natrinema versiforme]|uniref:Uncharacterized protein n=1 Tax=Natrinema versiforme JCM 10478 TaxID=1227496 RepID=L9Y8L6_9EURY|nr:hypothetical protein [Natrinema versiforme]ELY70007.1 hypothetical protein C489_03631 [Natrinema versiforme JCM 10478]